jgi:hypothetical protein
MKDKIPYSVLKTRFDEAAFALATLYPRRNQIADDYVKTVRRLEFIKERLIKACERKRLAVVQS